MKKIFLALMIVVNCYVYAASTSSSNVRKCSIDVDETTTPVLFLLKDIKESISLAEQIDRYDLRVVTPLDRGMQYRQYIMGQVFLLSADANSIYEEKKINLQRQKFDCLQKEINNKLRKCFAGPLKKIQKNQHLTAKKLIMSSSRSQTHKKQIKEDLDKVKKAITIVKNRLLLFGALPDDKKVNYQLKEQSWLNKLTNLLDNQESLGICLDNYEQIPLSR